MPIGKANGTKEKTFAKMKPEDLTDLQVPILDSAFCEKYINQLGTGKLVCRMNKLELRG